MTRLPVAIRPPAIRDGGPGGPGVGPVQQRPPSSLLDDQVMRRLVEQLRDRDARPPPPAGSFWASGPAAVPVLLEALERRETGRTVPGQAGLLETLDRRPGRVPGGRPGRDPACAKSPTCGRGWSGGRVLGATSAPGEPPCRRLLDDLKAQIRRPCHRPSWRRWRTSSSTSRRYRTPMCPDAEDFGAAGRGPDRRLAEMESGAVVRYSRSTRCSTGSTGNGTRDTGTRSTPLRRRPSCSRPLRPAIRHDRAGGCPRADSDSRRRRRSVARIRRFPQMYAVPTPGTGRGCARSTGSRIRLIYHDLTDLMCGSRPSRTPPAGSPATGPARRPDDV